MARVPRAPALAALIVLLAWLAAGPAPAASPPQALEARARGGPVRVVATIFPVATIVREIGGDLVAVSTVVPAGADPHSFELTPTTARAMGEAEILFSVAAAFDGWAIPADSPGGRQPSGGQSGPALVVLEPALKDSLMVLGGGFNPHFWLDPLIAREIGRLACRELCRVDQANCPTYEARTQVLAARLDSLDAAIRTRLEGLPARDFVAVHPAWTYFARRYGLRERSVLERVPEQEPSAKWIARVLKEMRRDKVRLVVAEEFSNMALATMVAEEVQAKVVVLDPLGGETRPGRDSYFALIDYNTSRLERALEGAK